jgi:hypothetical protein
MAKNEKRRLQQSCAENSWQSNGKSLTMTNFEKKREGCFMNALGMFIDGSDNDNYTHRLQR